MRDVLITIAETGPYLKRAEEIMSAAEREQVKDFLAANPDAGTIIAGTGGVRKIRIALQGRGKSGGARIVYYFHSTQQPLYLLHVFAKNEKENLSKAEKNALKQGMTRLKAALGKGQINE